MCLYKDTVEIKRNKQYRKEIKWDWKCQVCESLVPEIEIVAWTVPEFITWETNLLVIEWLKLQDDLMETPSYDNQIALW